MCYKGKCLHCLEVETGTLIFAIIQLICTSIGTMVTSSALIYFNLNMQDIITNYFAKLSRDQSLDRDLIVNVMGNALLAVALALISLAFAFSVVLIIGVRQRKAGYVRAYFIYGMINLVGLIIFGLTGLISDFDVGVMFIFIGIWTIKGLLLHMIHMTYRKFQGGALYQNMKNPISLIEKF